MPSPNIKTFLEITPLIYSWTTPDIPKYAGWEKIGYTEQGSAEARIAAGTAQLVPHAEVARTIEEQRVMALAAADPSPTRR